MNGLDPGAGVLTAKKINFVHFCVGSAQINVGKCGKCVFLGRCVLMFGCEEEFGLKNGSDKHCGKETSYTLLHISVGTLMRLFPLFCV